MSAILCGWVGADSGRTVGRSERMVQRAAGEGAGFGRKVGAFKTASTK